MPRYTKALLAVLVLLFSIGSANAAEFVRGLVVDRTNNTLWIGLPAPVKAGSVFDISLLPGGKVIARAEVIKSTPDAPFVAEATFEMEDPTAAIPLGAFAEASSRAVTDNIELMGYTPIKTTTTEVNPLSLEAGAFMPTGDLADETTSLWPALEVKYRVAGEPGADLRICLGFTRGEGNFEVLGLPGRRVTRVTPLTVEGRLPLGGRDGGWYAKLAAGGYHIREDRTVGEIAEQTRTTKFGWGAGFGYESARGRSFQVSFRSVPSTDFEGWMFTVGTRF